MAREQRITVPDVATQSDRDAVPATFRESKAQPFWQFSLATAAICVIGLLLRLPDITKSLWLDEAYTAWFTAHSFRQIWTEIPVYEVHPPLYNVILKAWTVLSGRSEAGLRSLSVAASVGTILVLATSGKVLRTGPLGDRVALLAALLLAVNAGNISFAQQARPYALETFTASVAILGALALLRRLQGGTMTLGRLLPAMGLLAFGAGITLWLHNTAVFIAYGIWIGLIIAILGFVSGRRWVQAFAVALPGLVALLLWSPFLLSFLHQSSHLASMAFWVTMSGNDLLSAWYLASGGSYPMVIVLTFAILGLSTLWRQQRPYAAFLSTLLFLPLATVLAISYFIKPFYIDRLFEWLTPIVLGLASLGMFMWLNSNLVRRFLMVAAVAFSLASTSVYYTLPTEDWRAVITSVLTQVKPGDIIVTNPNDISVPFAYYAPEKVAHSEILFTPTPYPSVEPVDGVQTFVGTRLMEPRDQAVVRDAIAGHSRVWLIERRADFYDPGDLVRKEIASTRKAHDTFSDTDITVTLFQ